MIKENSNKKKYKWKYSRVKRRKTTKKNFYFKNSNNFKNNFKKKLKFTKTKWIEKFKIEKEKEKSLKFNFYFNNYL